MWTRHKHTEYDHPIKLLRLGPRKVMIAETTTIFNTTIKKGTIVDGASVPRIFWWVLSPYTEGFRASIVHDIRHYPGMSWGERKYADYEFYDNLRKDGLNLIRAWVSWLGVRFYAYLTFWQWSK